MKKVFKMACCFFFTFFVFINSCAFINAEIPQKTPVDSTLNIGWEKCDITPAGPVMLRGQMYKRLALETHDPLYSTVLAFESPDGVQVVMISADLCAFSPELLAAIRKRIKKLETGLKPENIFGSATHTHTAPVFGMHNNGKEAAEIRKKYPKFIDQRQYLDFLAERISDTVVKAWRSRKAGYAAWGYGSAAVGENRRFILDDGTTSMYLSPAARKRVRCVEGHVDHGVNLLFTYDENRKLSGILINIACPAQCSGAERKVSADFWNEFRLLAAEKYGKDIFILPQCSAAGDLSPHKLIDKHADVRMLKLKGFMPGDVNSSVRRYNKEEYNMARRREIASRLMNAVENTLPYVSKDMRSGPVIRHDVSIVRLPATKITKEVADEYRKKADEIAKKTGDASNGWCLWMRRVVKRYEKPVAAISVEMHVVRVGDIVFATNPFEYYLDYSDCIKLKSPAVQTFLVQLAGGGSYLPSERSVKGGGYGSVPASFIVGPEGGKQLENATLKAINKIMKN